MHTSEMRAETAASLTGLGLHVAASAVDEGLGHDELLLQLNDARERKAATLEELRKAQKMLHLQEAQNEDLRQEIEEVPMHASHLPRRPPPRAIHVIRKPGDPLSIK